MQHARAELGFVIRRSLFQHTFPAVLNDGIADQDVGGTQFLPHPVAQAGHCTRHGDIRLHRQPAPSDCREFRLQLPGHFFLVKIIDRDVRSAPSQSARHDPAELSCRARHQANLTGEIEGKRR